MSKFQILLQKLFGDDYSKEFKELFAIAWPAILISFAKTFNFTISIIMCGHLSRVELDAVALSNTTLNIFGLCIALGLSTAMDTIFSRTFGRGEKHKMFMLLIKFWILAGCTFLIFASLHIQIESILLLLQQNPLIAKLSSFYILYYLPGLFFDFSFLTFARYLQNQNIVFPPMIFAFCGNIFNVVSQYIAIYVLNYGYLSSAICQAISSFVMFSTQLLYILCSKIYKDSDFNYRDILTDWGIFFKLGIPGILMVGLEEWSFEIATLAMGAIGVVQLGAQGIMFQVEAISYMIPLGVSIAVNIRVGQHLGAGSPQKAKNCYNLSMALIFCTATTIGILIASLSSIIPKIFTDDKEVIDTAAGIMVILGYFQLADGFSGVPAGAMRGCGRQLLGAILIFIGYYVISTPIGLLLAFAAGLEVRGMWFGLAIGISIEAILFVVVVAKTDWAKYARIASEGRKSSVLEVEEPSETDSLLNNPTRKRRVSYSRFSSVDGERVYEQLLLSERSNLSTKSLIIRRILALLVLILIFSASLIVRFTRSEFCVPISAFDNSTDIGSFPNVFFCNETADST